MDPSVTEYYGTYMGPMAGAVTFGHTICYASESPSQSSREHEHAHVRQADILGPAYLPLHILAQAVSAVVSGPAAAGGHNFNSDIFHEFNPLEWGPESSPATPWAWYPW